MLVRNGAKIYVKNPRVLHKEKIRETGTRYCGKGIEARDFSEGTDFSLGEKFRFLIERHSKLKSDIKKKQFLVEL